MATWGPEKQPWDRKGPPPINLARLEPSVPGTPLIILIIIWANLKLLFFFKRTLIHLHLVKYAMINNVYMNEQISRNPLSPSDPYTNIQMHIYRGFLPQSVSVYCLNPNPTGVKADLY